MSRTLFSSKWLSWAVTLLCLLLGPSAQAQTWLGRGPLTVAQGAAGYSTTSATEVSLVSPIVSGNSLGANGCVRISTVWSMTASANVKTLTIRPSAASGDISSAAFLNSVSGSSNLSGAFITVFCNANSLSAQKGGPASGNVGASNAGAITGAVNTANDWYVNINGKVAAGETLTLLWYVVEIIP